MSSRQQNIVQPCNVLSLTFQLWLQFANIALGTHHGPWVFADVVAATSHRGLCNIKKKENSEYLGIGIAASGSASQEQ